jgi:hypothetical protein
MPGYALNIDPLPSVAATGAPGDDFLHVQATPEMMGGAIARGLQGLGQGLEKASSEGFETATHLAQFHGKVNVDDQTNKWIDSTNRLLYGDPNKTVMGPDGRPTIDRGYMGLEGRSASDQRAGTLQALQEARQAGLKNLSNPEERYAYDASTRRMYSEYETKIGAHANQQWGVWAGGVNGAGAQHEMNEYVNAIADNDYEKTESHARQYVDFKVQQAKTKFGDDSKIVRETEAQAGLELLEAHVNYVAVKDPVMAIKILDSNRETAGVKYDDIYNRLRARKESMEGTDAATKQIVLATRRGMFTPVARSEVAGSVASAWRTQGMSDNGIAGVMFNINEESRFNPTLRHPDQPRYSPDDERHYAHGLYQEGAEEWTRYEQWLKANHPGSDWRDHRLQSEFAAWNLKTNYPAVWARMNAAATPEEAAAIYARGYLKPAAQYLQSRLAKIGEGIRPIDSYSGDASLVGETRGGGTAMPAVAGGPGLPGAPGAPAATAGAEPFTVAAPSRREQLAEALRGIEADPDLSEVARERARHVIHQEFQTLEIIDGQTARAKKDASDNAYGNYVKEIAMTLHSSNPDFAKLYGRITMDNDLAPSIKEHLLGRIAHFSGEEKVLEQLQSYGLDYVKARDALFSPPDAPEHVGSVAEAATKWPNITLAGLNDLNTRIKLARGSVDHHAMEQRLNSLLQGAKHDLSFEEDTGFFKMRDPKGERIYHMQFVPDVIKRVTELSDEAEKTGSHEKLDKYLNVENFDKLVQQYRPRNQMAADRLVAEGDASAGKGAANQPLPAAPNNINPTAWTSIVGAPPAVNGVTWPLKNWAGLLQKLHDNPTDEAKGAFNERFGSVGLTADDVLAKFRIEEKRPSPLTAAAQELAHRIGLDRH